MLLMSSHKLSGIPLITFQKLDTLWVWGGALAPRVSSNKNTQLQRRRATPTDPTKFKENHGIYPKQFRPSINVSLSTTDLSVYLALYGNEVLSITTESVKWTQKWNRIFFAIYLPLPGCVALPENKLWKHDAGEAAAHRSQQSHSGQGNPQMLMVENSEVKKKRRKKIW